MSEATPRKKRTEKKDATIAVRVTPATLLMYDQCAEQAGLDTSSWVRSVLYREVASVLKPERE